MKRLLQIFAPIAILALLPGCGLHPLYAGGGGRRRREHAGSSIEVAPIGGQSGWLVHNALNDRLHRQGEGPARYRLEVELNDEITGFGVRRDNAITRERRTLRARYRLVDIATGSVLLDQTASADAGIDVVGSEYATARRRADRARAADRASLADEIVARVATYAGRSAAK